MEEELNLSNIIEIIRKWIILIIAFVAVGLVGAVVYNSLATVKYQSRTTLYIEPSVSGGGVEYNDILTNQKMVKTYVEMIKSRKIVNKVIANLDLNMNYEELLSMLSISSETDTQIITITIKDTSASRAATIANTFAKIFISDLQNGMDITNVKVFDEAVPNENAVEPRKLINIGIGVVGGGAIALLLVFAIEMMDNKIKTHDDVKKYLDIKTLGIVPLNSIDSDVKGKKYSKIADENKTNIKIIDDPNSVVSESIRMIRTNLNFADLKLINITSTVPSEGKSEFVTNIATSFAMLDKKVLVVDCDLRKPKIHRDFGIERGKGVTDIILSKGTLDYKKVIKKYTAENVKLDILCAGSLVSNPSELINSKYFADLVEKLKENYDLVLLDCPPISTLTDGILVSKLADGTVYVIESDRTDKELIANSIEELKSNKAFILGAVLTKVNVKKQKNKYGYKYGYYYSNYYN